MKVLQVCAYAAKYGGNFMASLMALEAALAEQNVETAYLFPETARNMPWCVELQSRAEVHFAGLNRFSPKVFGQVKAAMADADVIHSHFELYDCLTALAKKKKQRLFWHLHDSFDEVIDLPHMIINRFQYGVLSKNTTLISPNGYYSDMVAGWRFPRKQIVHVDNAVDFSRLRIENKEKKLDFLVFGGFYQINGLDVLMDACRILREKQMDFQVGVVGYADTWRFLDDKYPDQETVVNRLEPSENVSEFYNTATVFISASRRETFSYSLLEALYMGLDAVVSDIPGTGWANNYATVSVVAGENAEALAKEMEKKLIEVSAPSIKAEVIEDVQKRYSVCGWVDAIKEIYFGT